jgi:Mg2+ and Co2+ transporter CorA
MISKYSHKQLVWIDLENPTNEEIVHILEEYEIPEYIKNMFKTELGRDAMYSDYDYIFVCLPFLSEKNTIESRLIFIVSDDFIISFHDEPTTVLGQFFKEVELSIVSNDKLIIDNNRLLFTYLLKSLYVNSERQLIMNESMVKNYQKNIIKINKKNMTLKVLSFILLGAIILISILCL